MTRSKGEFSTGDSVVSTAYGKGVVVSVETIEKPGDSDGTMYRVALESGETRHFKASELKGTRAAD